MLAFQDPEEDVMRQAGDGFGNQTMVHPVGVAMLGVLSLLALLLPRRWATLPVVLLLCFLPAGQRIVVATIDFPFLRVLWLVTWTRLVVRRELRPILWNNLDRLFVIWSVVLIGTGTLQLMTLSALINRVGFAVDSCMAFFFFRMVLRDSRDLITIATQFALCAFPVALFFVIEHQTSRNIFGALGGVPEITDIREGRLRCQGAFAHPILAGCFWACVIPFFLARGWITKRWLLPIGGTLAGLMIVAMTASSTPMMAVVFAIVGVMAWMLRGALRWFRWAIFGLLTALHCFFMQTPVWHLLSRIDIVGGSTGYHRFHLIDECIHHFGDWCLVGVQGTGYWGYGLQDVTNQFVAEAVLGGLLRLLLFCAIVVHAFIGVSRTVRTPGVPLPHKYIAWSIGTVLFMHCMNFIAVSYFEQIVVLWLLTLAAAASLTSVPGADPRVQMARVLMPAMSA